MKGMFEKVGAHHIVQIVTDNKALLKAVRRMIHKEILCQPQYLQGVPATQKEDSKSSFIVARWYFSCLIWRRLEDLPLNMTLEKEKPACGKHREVPHERIRL